MKLEFWKNMGKKKKIAITAAAALVILLIVIIVVVCLTGKNQKTENKAKQAGSEKNISETKDKPKEKEEEQVQTQESQQDTASLDAPVEEVLQEQPQQTTQQDNQENQQQTSDTQTVATVDSEQPQQQTETNTSQTTEAVQNTEQATQQQSFVSAQTIQTQTQETNQQTASSWKDSFKNEGNIYTCTKTSGTPIAGGGLKIIVNLSDKSVKYIITDTKGTETVEYMTFNYNRNQVERYQYVSAMGQGFYYYCDLEGNNLSVFNTSGEDRTVGAQESGHYNSAVDGTREMIHSYSNYFQTAFGVSAQQAATGN